MAPSSSSRADGQSGDRAVDSDTFLSTARRTRCLPRCPYAFSPFAAEVAIIADPEVIIVPVVFLFPTVAIMTRMFLKHREKMASLKAPVERSGESDARMARLEQAVEAIAIEVERIGESQRFLTKVLTDKSLPSGDVR